MVNLSVIRVAAVAAAIVLLCIAPAGALRAADTPAPTGPYLSGKLLVATPRMGDPRFARTVIYMVEHSARGAMGLVVNRALGSGSLGKLLKGFGLGGEGVEGDIRLYYGGPVEPGAGFILHSTDFAGPHTTVVNGQLGLSTEMEVLKAIAEGRGPKHSLFALGYAGWGPGQLEGEIAREDWVSAPVDEKLIFSDDPVSIWERASASAGLAL